MITKMKKLLFLAYHKDYVEFLNSLRELGVIHVVERKDKVVDDVDLQDNTKLLTRLTTAIKLLEGLALPDKAVRVIDGGSEEKGLQVLDQLDELLAEKAKLQQQLQSYSKDEDVLQAWGDFDPVNIERLKQAGYMVNFFTCPQSAYNEEWTTKYDIININTVGSKLYFITLTKTDEQVDIDAELVKLPAYSLTQLAALRQQVDKAILKNDESQLDLSLKDIPSLKMASRIVQQQLDFSKVILSTEQMAGDKLMLLEGWVPATNAAAVETFLDESHVYYQMSDPTPEDNVPIKLSNKVFFSWFEPICKLYMLPRYNELDLTPYFAPFFMVFFGLCLGDSGYGLFLFICATLYRVLKKNISPSTKSILSLIQVLATSTFFCGLLTGTFFGANIYDLDWPWVKKMESALRLDNNQMFQLSLLCGVVQILFGMVLKAVNQTIQFGFKYALATIGWIILLVSTGLSAVLPEVLPMGGTIHLIILGIAAIGIFLFNSPGKNIFLNIGLGFWDSYNMITGLLGDILSYVRLFALGLSGGILAGVFNSLAKGMSPDNAILGPIVMVLIFLIGHAINMFMNVLGAMVHPMRLTFVEFFKNAGYEGGGKEYKPFKK